MLELLTVLLGAYLTCVNALADRIEALLPPPDTIPEEVVPDTSPESAVSETSVLDRIASEYGGGSLPHILIQNAAYQQASVIESSSEASSESAILSDALVNIYCTFTSATQIRTTTGTGFFVADTGVILTNAHVAQFLLLDGLEEGTVSQCSVRTGTDPKPTYAVDLLYIPPSWIRKHAALIDDPRPRGSGERDFALLYTTHVLQDTEAPIKTPFLTVDTALMSPDARNATVTLGGYPATTDTDGTTVTPQTIATTTIADLFTFTTTHADIMYLRGSRVGEHGASGGPVIDEDGNVIGLISTKGNDAELGTGSLHAITLSYIDRTIKEETGFGFMESTRGNLPYRAQLFRETLVPFLKQFLADELE